MVYLDVRETANERPTTWSSMPGTPRLLMEVTRSTIEEEEMTMVALKGKTR
jgi:hypothetical protein